MIKGIFLGTGSIPTKERSCQGVLLEFNDTSILVDCGEGIQYQLLKSDTDISKINSIFITHEHIDHVYGIGGVLTLLLNKFLEKNITIYAPRNVIQIVRTIVDAFLLKGRSRIEYIEVDCNSVINRDLYTCSTFKTYHTDSSLGYFFQYCDKKVALLGDVAILNTNDHEEIVRNIYDADLAVIDGVHITVDQAASLAKDAKVRNAYFMPILLNKTDEEVLNQVTSVCTGAHIPIDLEKFELH